MKGINIDSNSFFFVKHINKKISIGCCQTRRASKAGYDICHNDEETGNAKVNDNTNTDDLSEEDFTLRTVESLEVDAMLSKLSLEESFLPRIVKG